METGGVLTEPTWTVREEPEGFSIAKDGEDFMGWYRTRADAEEGILALRIGENLPSLLKRITESKTPRLLP